MYRPLDARGGPQSCGPGGVADVHKPRPRALDLRGLGARRFSVVDWAHPDIEYSIVGGLESGRWWGVRAMTERSREQLSEFDHFRIEVDGCREVDEERVLVLWRFRGRGKASGLEPPGTGGPICSRFATAR